MLKQLLAPFFTFLSSNCSYSPFLNSQLNPHFLRLSQGDLSCRHNENTAAVVLQCKHFLEKVEAREKQNHLTGKKPGTAASALAWRAHHHHHRHQLPLDGNKPACSCPDSAELHDVHPATDGVCKSMCTHTPTLVQSSVVKVHTAIRIFSTELSARK